MKFLTYDPHKKKKVLCGELIGDTLFRWVKPEHFMNVVQGYGIQEIAFRQLVKKDCKYIILKEKDTNKRWKANIKAWKELGRVADYGHGKQRFLSLKYMRPHTITEEDEKKKAKRRKSIIQSKLL